MDAAVAKKSPLQISSLLTSITTVPPHYPPAAWLLRLEFVCADLGQHRLALGISASR
jgi:hypothetical protein